VVKKVLVACEDAVGDPVVAQELPDIFDRIEFGTLRRQRDESDVLRPDEAARQMPTGLIEQKRGMSARRDLFCDFGKMQFIASVLQAGKTSAAPLPSLGQMAPKI
jgi:hypothetical protein